MVVSTVSSFIRIDLSRSQVLSHGSIEASSFILAIFLGSCSSISIRSVSCFSLDPLDPRVGVGIERIEN